MSTTRRGISDHEIVQTMEETRRRLASVGVSQLEADRVGVVLTLMLASPLCTVKEAIAAADRLFPLGKEHRG